MIAKLLLPLLATTWFAEAPKVEVRTYHDDRLGFSFSYPADYTLTNVLESRSGFVSGVLKRGNADILVEAKDLADYPSEWLSQGRTSFVNAALAIARLMCDADGPDGSRSCPEVLKQSTFGNRHGLECLEVDLREVITESEPSRFTTRTKGPVYAVRIPRPELPVILFFEFAPDFTSRTADAHVLHEIVNSVKGK